MLWYHGRSPMEYAIHTTTPHLLWLLLVLANFIIQLKYFAKPDRGFFIAKRITTPLLLFGALLVIWLTSDTIPLVQGLILAAMGLGELGIEGSRIVESREEKNPAANSWIVTFAGVIFLAVNVYLGAVLIFEGPSPSASLFGFAIGTVSVAMLVFAIQKFHNNSREVTVQIALYALGLAFLLTGALASLFESRGSTDPNHLGLAALILSISDSLVLWRMGAGWNKEEKSDRTRMQIFLIIILLLYYFYIGLMIDSASPFRIPL